MAQVRDAGNLLTRAGLTIPAVDVDDLVVRYPSAAELVGHLRVRPKPCQPQWQSSERFVGALPQRCRVGGPSQGAP